MAMAVLGCVPRHAYEDASFRGALDRLESLRGFPLQNLGRNPVR